MANRSTCPKCGVLITADALLDICPKCLLGQVLASEPASTVDASPLVPQRGDWIGQYQLIEKIGEGGWGIVYMAEQIEPRRRVALKVIKTGMDTEDVVARFEAERQAIAIMEHPNIATIFDGGTTPGGRPYFVMELLRGTRITHFCDEHDLSIRQRLELFQEVCYAVQHAHQKGVIHRDLKPSNVLVVLTGDVPQPKVIDFGIAKAIGQKLTDVTLVTRSSYLMGTPAYMSPEQASIGRRRDIDTRSDVYSLGVILYELLTGCLPFGGEEFRDLPLDELLRMIRETEPTRPSTRVSSLGAVVRGATAAQRQVEPSKLMHSLQGDLDCITMKCLEKDRDRRYATVNELIADIERYLTDQPVLARPPSVPYRAQKLFRRRGQMVAAILSVAVTLVCGTILTTRQAIWKRQAEHRANVQADQTDRLLALLRDVLGDVRAGAQGHSPILLRELVDMAVNHVERELPHQPRAEAALRAILGEIYVDLHDYQNAENMFRRSLALVTQTNSLARESVLDLQYNLARALAAQDKLIEAEPLFTEVFVASKKLPRYNRATYVGLLTNFATAQYKLRKLADAEGLFREALAVNKRALGDNNVEIIFSLEKVGDLLAEQGKFPEAEAVFRDQLGLAKRLFINDHPEVAIALFKLAAVLNSQNRTAEAEQMLGGALFMRKQPGGARGPDMGEILTQYAFVLNKQGKGQRAQPIDAIARSVKADPSRLAHSFMLLAVELLREKKPSESAALVQQALDIRGELDEMSLLGFECAYNAATVFNSAGNFTQAEAIYRQLLDKRNRPFSESTYLPPDPEEFRCLVSLGTLVASYNPPRQANEFFRRATALAQGLLATEDYELILCLNHLGNSLVKQKKFLEARQVFDEANDAFRDMMAVRQWRSNPCPPHSVPAIFTRADALAAAGNYDEAEKLFRVGSGILRDTDHRPLEAELHFLARIAAFYDSWERVAPNTGKAREAENWRNHLSARLRDSP